REPGAERRRHQQLVLGGDDPTERRDAEPRDRRRRWDQRGFRIVAALNRQHRRKEHFDGRWRRSPVLRVVAPDRELDYRLQRRRHQRRWNPVLAGVGYVGELRGLGELVEPARRRWRRNVRSDSERCTGWMEWFGEPQLRPALR